MFRLATAVSIWETPSWTRNCSLLSSAPSVADFGATFKSEPFVFEANLATGVLSDDFLDELVGDFAAPFVETSHRERRESRALLRVGISDFLAVYRDRPLYLTSQAPPPLRRFLKFPGFLGGLQQFLLSTPLWWLAFGATKSAIHRDSDSNVHCVLDGTKRFLLWPPDAPLASDAFGWFEAQTASDGYGEWARAVDVDDVVEPFLSNFRTQAAVAATVSAGSCIHIPAMWFHFVESGNGRTLSYHLWFKAVAGVGNLSSVSEFAANQCQFRDDMFASDFRATHPEILSRCLLFDCCVGRGLERYS